MNLQLPPVRKESVENTHDSPPPRDAEATGAPELVAEPFPLSAEDRSALADWAVAENHATPEMLQDVTEP